MAAVSVRRGSTTISLPPRALSALAWPRKSGTVHMLPFEAIGFAPSTSSHCVRSMSGTATESQWPNISPEASCLGIWSSVEALNTLRVPSALSSRELPSVSPSLCTVGLPRHTPSASRPCACNSGSRRCSISAKASSHVAST